MISVLDFFSSAPCQQRLPGMAFKDERRTPITTCPECDGIMLVGQCARDEARDQIQRAARA
jgi:hypothetical protein